MAKVVKTEKVNGRTLQRSQEVLKRIGASLLAATIMVSTATHAKAAENKTKYLYVKQPEVVGNYYYQFGWNDANKDNIVAKSEITWDKYFVADPTEVLPQVNPTLYAVSFNESEYGWYNLGEYDPNVGVRPSVEQANEMLRERQTDDKEFYIMQKKPEIINDGEDVRWYYWQDKDKDGYTDNRELYYYDLELRPEIGFIPGQPDANVFAYSDTMFVDGWEAVDVYNPETDFVLRNVQTVDEQIDKNEERSIYKLRYLPNKSQ